MTYIQQAFDLICTQQKQPSIFYVSLVESIPYYGGPEEGGWWGTDTELIAYQEFASEELACEAAEKVAALAAELQQQSQNEYGEQCLREMTWLEERGLDSDFLPEPDGSSEYSVVVSQELPQSRRGCRQYS